MEKEENHKVIYDNTVIDFVAVGVEFCLILEGDETLKRDEWIDRMLKLLPLLYIKASLLPKVTPVFGVEASDFVREEDYSRVVLRVEEIMGEENVFLEVFMDDMMYSDTPVTASVSECIADIYQDIRNFVSVYQFELTDQMNGALQRCVEHFNTYWGQKLVNVLRPLHALKSVEWSNSIDDDLNVEAMWD